MAKPGSDQEPDRSADVIVVGSGINSLVATATLALAGRRVILLEQADHLGGFIRSAEVTVPGFIHDLYSSWHPLFVAGGAYRTLRGELEKYGLTYANSDGPVCATVEPELDRPPVIAYRDPEQTAQSFSSAPDRAAYSDMLQEVGQRAPVAFGALGSELGRRRTLFKLGWRAIRTLGFAGTQAMLRDSLSSGRMFLRRRFEGYEADALWSPWLLHAGLNPDSASGGAMIPIFALTMHSFGLPVVVGGASRFVEAFEGIFRNCGVRVHTSTTVESIRVEAGRAKGVHTTAGDFDAPVVLASVTPSSLYGQLLADVEAVEQQREAAREYRPGRAAMMIHLALDHPVPWRDEILRQLPLVHLSSGTAGTGIACAQADAGMLPQAPTIVVGQQSLLDPSRAPAGKATLWLQLQEVPFVPIGDANGVIDVTGGWENPALVTAYLERILERIERAAPGFRTSILGTHVISPLDLRAANPNAEDGDPYGGRAELDQNLIWRPLLGAAGHATRIRGLWHIGSSTHPGPGLGGESGRLAAQQVLRR